VTFDLYSLKDNPKRSDFYVSVSINDRPLNVFNCSLDSGKYLCPWDTFSLYLLSRSFPNSQDPDIMCFKHLENRDRPSVIEGNVSWWLASAISVPSVLATLIYIRRRQKRKEIERIQREERERQERETLIKR
jgi:hypothetical protein